MFTLPPAVLQDIRAWIDARGRHSGALFTNFDRIQRSKAGGRLTGAAIYYIVKQRSVAAGISPSVMYPNGLRSAGIVEAMNGYIRGDKSMDDIPRFPRHADVRTVLKYIDGDPLSRASRLLSFRSGVTVRGCRGRKTSDPND